MNRVAAQGFMLVREASLGLPDAGAGLSDAGDAGFSDAGAAAFSDAGAAGLSEAAGAVLDDDSGADLRREAEALALADALAEMRVPGFGDAAGGLDDCAGADDAGAAVGCVVDSGAFGRFASRYALSSTAI